MDAKDWSSEYIFAIHAYSNPEYLGKLRIEIQIVSGMVWALHWEKSQENSPKCSLS